MNAALRNELWPAPRIPLLLPVKTLAAAKTRLAGILSADERSDLVLAMLADVLAAVRHARLEAYVLTPDPRVVALAEAAQVGTILERPRVGSLSRAVEWASGQLARVSDAVLVLLPDVPLVTAAELHALLGELVPIGTPNQARGRSIVYSTVGAPTPEVAPRYQDAGQAPRVVVATDRASRGSNALLVRPPGAIPLGFGRRSLARHLEAAAIRGIPAKVCQLPGLAHDIDEPRDVAALMLGSGSTRTERYLRTLGVRARLEPRPTERAD